MHLLDNEYLNNPVIADVTYYITLDKINIESPSTSWLKAERITNIIPLNDLLYSYKAIVKEAKQRKYGMSYKQKVKDSIINEYTNYIEEIQKSNIIFDQMIFVSKQLHKRKLHYDCVDDQVLNDLHKLSSEYKKIFYGGTAYKHKQTIIL